MTSICEPLLAGQTRTAPFSVRPWKIGSDDVGLALARLFSSAAECGDAINCAKRIEAGAKLREAKVRKREKNREARSRKKAARPIAKAIAARNWALNGDAEEGDVAPEYQKTTIRDLFSGEVEWREVSCD